MRGQQALDRLLSDYPDVRTILDIGSGSGHHAKLMREAGKSVTTNSLIEPADHVGNYLNQRFSDPFDAIWASHVLEHQPNVGDFLRKCFSDLRDEGVLAITVPPAKHAVVGGHLTIWNAGLLLYNLIVSGFDCHKARVSGIYGYNISVIVCKHAANLPSLNYDQGDIERLCRFFPIPVQQGFDGRLQPTNW